MMARGLTGVKTLLYHDEFAVLFLRRSSRLGCYTLRIQPLREVGLNVPAKQL